jgi:hypothetical protein
MVTDSPDVTTLVFTLCRHFEHDATRDDVRCAVQNACIAMHAGGVPPQTMLVTLKTAVKSASLDARTIVSRDMLRALTSELTPWMIEVCFGPEERWRT